MGVITVRSCIFFVISNTANMTIGPQGNMAIEQLYRPNGSGACLDMGVTRFRSFQEYLFVFSNIANIRIGSHGEHGFRTAPLEDW